MGATYVAHIESEGLAAANRLPAQAILSEPALARLLGQVQVDVVEALTKVELADCWQCGLRRKKWRLQSCRAQRVLKLCRAGQIAAAATNEEGLT